MTLTLDLLEVLRNGSSRRDDLTMVKHAKKNKVLLQLLRNIDDKGALREKEERGYEEIVVALGEVSKQLSGLRYSLIKFNKPVLYSPADIDLLVSCEELPPVLRRLSELGYSQRVCEPYCVTLEKKVTLDIYTHPCVANVPYIDGRILLEHVRETEVAGSMLPSLERGAESMLSASHAVYKEQLFTLNDYFTFKEWFGPLTEDLARESKVEAALRMTEILSERVRHGCIDLPYRLGLVEISRIFSEKILRDHQTRASLVRALTKWRSREFLSKARASRTRPTY